MTPLLLVTPTRDRAACFALCERWMAAQTYRGERLWLVVDDGDTPAVCTMGQTVIRRERKRGEPSHTLSLNLTAAMPYIQDAERVLIVENDDAYGPTYIETMLRWLDTADLIGEVGAKYYHVGRRAYKYFAQHTHASLCRTGFTRKAAPLFERCVRRCVTARTPTVDMLLWGGWDGSRLTFHDPKGESRLCVGIKGMPGLAGHGHERKDYTPDPDMAVLKRWVGEDYTAYLPFGEAEPQKGMEKVGIFYKPELTVYTAILGGYDRLKPVRRIPGVRYVCFSDRKQPDPGNWEIVRVDGTDSVGLTRWHKMHPHTLFPDAAHSLWLDASMRLKVSPLAIAQAAGDAPLYLSRHHKRDCILQEARECIRLGRCNASDPVEAQARSYIDAGHPENWGLYTGGMIYRRHTPEVARFNEAWWAEFEKWHNLGASRDQISLPYVLRTTGIPFASFDAGQRGRWVTLSPHRVITPMRRSAEQVAGVRPARRSYRNRGMLTPEKVG